ncbi:calcium-binding and coiled-coil domain-containing protein 1-like [Mustela nigripes]|uniref:calcium-binding and coiled-coil domain-containing protein 1-like n=1 Tax=Mustela nigripes TaxID=77151 RepID=UPI0028160458|nr:calcium-binding and coiled-coil domain-containing protein 1-like [Mustela nigripes]
MNQGATSATSLKKVGGPGFRHQLSLSAHKNDLQTSQLPAQTQSPVLPIPICEMPGLSIWAEPLLQFQDPRPMDEVVTVEETDGGIDILLVVPKTTVLSVRTEKQNSSWARK